jgi:hypothetical protein
MRPARRVIMRCEFALHNRKIQNMLMPIRQQPAAAGDALPTATTEHVMLRWRASAENDLDGETTMAGSLIETTPLDRALLAHPCLRAALCGAALKAAVAGGNLTIAAGGDASAMFWSHRQRFAGIDLAIIDAGAGPAPGDDPIGHAEAALNAARQTGAVDIMVLQIAHGARPGKPPRGFQQAMGGDYLAIERGLTRRETLPIGDDYASFLQSLGHDTRRNAHRYRRKAEAAGLSFRFAWGPPPPDEADRRYRLGAATRPIQKSRRRIDAHDRFIAARARPYQAWLEKPDGEPASFATGFVTGDGGYLVYQLNDPAFAAISLSMTLRTYVIEALSAAGVRALIFPNGCGGLLGNACEVRRGTAIVAIRSSAGGLIKTLAAAAFAETGYVRKASISAARHTIAEWRSKH